MTDTETTATQALMPYLVRPRRAAALDFYRDAFGAFETIRFVGDDGRMGHAEFTIGGARFMMADEYPEIGVRRAPPTSAARPCPSPRGGRRRPRPRPGRRRRGATACAPPEDQSHGNRTATIVDPFGHRWMLSQPIERARAPRTYAAAEEAPATSPTTATDRPRSSPATSPCRPPTSSGPGPSSARSSPGQVEAGTRRGRRPHRQHPLPHGLHAAEEPRPRAPSPSTSGSTTSSPTPPGSRSWADRS